MAARGSKASGRDEGFKKALEEEEALAEALESGDILRVSMSEMASGIEGLESAPEGSTSHRELVDQELEELMEHDTPRLPQESSVQTLKDLEKINLDDSQEQRAEDEGDYPESFASQKETSQLREEIENLHDQMSRMSSDLQALINERAAIPDHLTKIKSDLNIQLTAIADRLYSVLESDIPRSDIRAATSAVSELKDKSSEQLSAAADYARDRPREGSPLATKGAKLEGKRRFRAVK